MIKFNPIDTAMTLEQIKTEYERDGYIVVRGIIPSKDLDPVRDAIRRGVDRFARENFENGNISSLYANESLERRYAAICEEMEHPPRAWTGSKYGPEFYDLYNHSCILDVLGAILGPEVTNHATPALRTKLPGSTLSSFPWHQDSHYYNEPKLGTWGSPTEQMHIVTVWVPLVDATAENGCLWVIPRSHRWGLLKAARQQNNNVLTREDVLKRGTEEGLPMKVGDVLFMTNLTLHTSKVNRTKQSRWSIDFRYHPTAGSQPMSKEEADGTAYMMEKARKNGLEPLLVLTNGEKPTWEEWNRQNEELQAELAAS